MPQSKALEIHLDKCGSFGIKSSNEDTFILSMALSPPQDLLTTNLTTLESKLKTARFTGMIHTAPLVNKRSNSPFANFGLSRRQAIFWALFHFMINSQIQHYSIIVNKTTTNSIPSLKHQLSEGLKTFYEKILPLLSPTESVILYYDNGQPKMGELIDALCATRPRLQHEVIFEREQNRLFQVADMLTYIEKLLYRHQNNLPLTRGEQWFFSNDEIRFLQKQLQSNHL